MKKFLVLALMAVATMSVVDYAFAQRDAGAKSRGEFGMSGGFAGRSMQGARAASNDYRQYIQQHVLTAPQVVNATPQQPVNPVPHQHVNPELARHVSDTIGDYIEKSQKHMAWMRKQAAGDTETLASIDLIDKSLADASISHKEMHAMCLKENVHADGNMKCCETIDKSLAVAIAEHDKLMKRLLAEKTAVQKQ